MDMALRFSGWLKVTNPMPPSRAASILPPAYAVVPTFSSISDHSLLAHRGDLGVGVADRLHDLRPDARRHPACSSRIALEKPEMLIAEATTSVSPIYGLTIFVAMPRCFTCGSANT